MAVLGLSRRKKKKKKKKRSSPLKKKIGLGGEKIFALGGKKNENEQKKNYWKQRPKKKMKSFWYENKYSF